MSIIMTLVEIGYVIGIVVLGIMTWVFGRSRKAKKLKIYQENLQKVQDAKCPWSEVHR